MVSLSISSNAYAAITIDIRDAVVLEGSAVAEIDVVIRSDVVDGDIPISILSDFIVDGAEFLDPPGEFDQPGFYNAGNYDGASAIIRDTNNRGFAFASFDMDPAIAVPTSDVILARLFVDAAPLPVGNYDLRAENVLILDGNAVEIASTPQGGTLSVVAIPEPSSLAFVALIGGAVFCRRKRQAVTQV
ncbi:MAG: PEP-CTERM sorting domain-containing protein [Planctomycetota bacterium]